MAAKTSKVTIKFTKEGLQPPVYLAGSFSTPAWEPQEMEYIVDEHSEHKYHKEVKVEEGMEYQYKFRLGEGDWWVLNEESPIATDDIGNRNNLLIVTAKEESKDKPLELSEPPKMLTNDGVVESIPGSHNIGLEDLQKKEDTIGDDAAINPPSILPVEPETAIETEHGDESETASSLDLVSEGIVTPQSQDDNFDKENDANLLQAPNDDSGYVVIGSGARTPDIASVAAEVADSAEYLDRNTPTPPISDEEAGRIGLRRLSQTPIPEVAKTASEVADSAAIVDHPHMHIDIPPPSIDIERSDDLGSGNVTPLEDRAPRFAHECPSPHEGFLRPASSEEYEARGPQDPFERSPIDLDDPSIEHFPSDREAIYEQVRSCQRRMSADPTFVDGVPPSPVVTGSAAELPILSPNLLSKSVERSPSLLSIPEEHNTQESLTLPQALRPPTSNPDPRGGANEGERQASVDSIYSADGTLSLSFPPIQETHNQDAIEFSSSNPIEPLIPSLDTVESLDNQTGVKSLTSTPVEISKEGHPEAESTSPNTPESSMNSHEQIDRELVTPPPIELPPTPYVLSQDVQLDVEDTSPREIVTPVEGPSITVLPATPGTSLKIKGSDPFENLTNDSTITAIDVSETQLKSRKTASPVPERPLTPSSVRSAGKEAKSKNFLKAFLKLIFVDWIGGILVKIFGGGRQTQLATLLLIVTIAPALYFSEELTAWFSSVSK